jgi:hypothetical protein
LSANPPKFPPFLSDERLLAVALNGFSADIAR